MELADLKRCVVGAKSMILSPLASIASHRIALLAFLSLAVRPPLCQFVRRSLAVVSAAAVVTLKNGANPE